MNFSGRTIAFLGDSITEGIAATCPENIFHAHLGKMWNAKVLNYGISGTRFAKQTIPSAAASFDLDFVLRADQLQGDIVFVFGGTNDFGHGDAPFGELSDTTEQTFCGACNVLFEKLVKRFGKDNVVCILPLHRTEENNIYGDGSKKVASKTLVEYAEAEKVLAARHNIRTIDLWNSKLNPNIPEGKIYFADTVHPSDLGHKQLAEEIYRATKNW